VNWYEQEGILTIAYSSEAPTEKEKQNIIASLLKNLTWMMFNLGGIGQGARRPCYSRKTRERAPWYRGSTLIPNNDEPFWELPDTLKEFQELFQQHLRDFYKALSLLPEMKNLRNLNSPNSVGNPRSDTWTEAVDLNCEIVVCTGEENHGKPYALSILHSPDFKIQQQGREDYDGNLCGKVGKEVKPSPVWIADLGDYQVVTVFGATQNSQNPRQRYLQELRSHTSRQNHAKIWPLS
jgi:CRISPR-associated protein Cmr6